MMMVKGEGGADFENICRSIIENICRSNNLEMSGQTYLEMPKPGGGKHRVDFEVVSTQNQEIRGLFSCKYQKGGGTADEKIAYEVIKLLAAMKLDPRYKHSWIALGGNGWSNSIKGFISEGHIQEWIPAMKGKVTIFMDPNDLMARAKNEVMLSLE
jgi:hypothetical protein